MNAKDTTRRLAAIMFTDMEGYTAVMQQDEAKAAAMRALHRKVFSALHDQYHGQIIQYFGDGTLSVFQSGVEAVECAVAIQEAVTQSEPIIPLRIGVHLGDIVFDGPEIFGDGVNLASRIESMGVAGAILLSENLNRELANQKHLRTLSLGTFALKNVTEPVEIFAVTNRGIRVPLRNELKGKRKKPSRSIAVLPFANMSADQETEYFCDGMTEEIINALTRVKGLKVTSRTSSFYFKNKHIPIPQIGRELHVSVILEGSIRLAGSKMRITCQLIDVAEDIHFWSETFDRSIDDVFAVQDEISLLIADRLREELGHLDIEEHLVESPNIPVEVYKRYLKGRYHILKMSKADIDLGIALMKSIVSEQPHYIMGYLGTHLGYTLKGTIGLIPSEEAFAKSHPYLEKAIELEPDHPECQLHLAWTKLLVDWDLSKAYDHINKALESRPMVDFYQTMATILIADAKFAAAHQYLQTARQLDPFSEVNYHLTGFTYYSAGRFEQAIPFFEKSIGLNANFSISNLYLGQALICQGKKEEALAFFQSLPEDEPGDIPKLGGLTLAYAALGRQEEAQTGIAKLESYLETALVERALNILIRCHAVLGNADKTMDYIARGIQMRLPLLVYVPTEPMLSGLVEKDRFQDLVQQIFPNKAALSIPTRKYKKALFDQEELEAHRKKLLSWMEQHKPFLAPQLTLRQLADQLHIPPNHLSQLLNEGFGQNFSEFVNSYRLERFKEGVSDPAKRYLTILGLALESGFNSKTVFNTFFKKQMGKTPKAYWKENAPE